jgi:hypothetical protein
MEQKHFGSGDNIYGDKTTNNNFSIGKKGWIFIMALTSFLLGIGAFYYYTYVREPDKNIINFQFGDDFYDVCMYPSIFPDDVMKGVQKDTIVEIEVAPFHIQKLYAKGPAFIKEASEDGENAGFYGFGLPFHILSNNLKKEVILSNKFKVNIKVDPPLDFANLDWSCAGDGAFYDSQDTVILSSEKKNYSKDIVFPKAKFYTSKPDELNSFQVFFKAKNAGIYHVEIEIPFIFNNKNRTATFKIPDFVVPQKFHGWDFTDSKSQGKTSYKRPNATAVWQGNTYVFEDEKGVKKSNEKSNEKSVEMPISTTSISTGKYPFTATRLVKNDDLAPFSKAELKIMRNEILARKGYIFKTPEMIEYFSKQGWYKPLVDENGNPVLKPLSEIEQKNIAFIKEFEQK